MLTDPLEYIGQTALAIAPRYLGYMLAVLQGRAEATKPRADVAVRGRRIESLQVIDGIAVVPVMGPILHRADLFSSFGATSVGSIRANIGAALDDPTVEGILMVVDSPGGEVAGIADLADDLYGARKRKPMLVVADEGMHSAAYWLGSAAGQIALPRTGSVGSIGALVVHTDISGALDKMGAKVTVIKSGRKKAQFSPFAPLSEDARAALQMEVDRISDLFIGAVAQYRNVDAETLRNLEGGTLEGQAAVDGGLADGIDTVEGAFLALKMQAIEQEELMRLGPQPKRAADESLGFDIGALTTVGASREGGSIMATETPGVGTPAAPREEPAASTAQRLETPLAITSNVLNMEVMRKAMREEAGKAERARATEITHWCQFVGRIEDAEAYIASTMTIEQVRQDLVNRTAAASFQDIQGQRSSLAPKHYLTVEEIYASRRMAVKEAKLNRRYL